MSVSLWRWTEACDARSCPGDCDECGFDPQEEEDEDAKDGQRAQITG